MTGRIAGRAATAATLVLLATGPPAAGAAAADDCANHALRDQQGAARLPDCRAYEQVSPVDKNGGTIAAGLGARGQAGGITFWSTSAFAGAPGSISATYRALRGEHGWTTTSLNPPTLGRNPILMDQFYLSAMAKDFSRGVIETKYPVDPDDQGTGTFANIGHFDDYRFEGDGRFTWVSSPSSLPDVSPKETYFAAATDDLERIAFNSTKSLTDDGGETTTSQQVYVRDGDTTRLVSVAPGGGALPGGAALGGNDWVNATGSVVDGVYRSALSADGSTVYFATREHPDAPQLYVRTDALGPDAATAQVSRSRVTGAADGAGCELSVTFLRATRDGSRLWFGCPTKLTDDAPPDGGVYVYDRDADHLEYVAPPAASTGRVADQIRPVAADPDVDYLWFTSQAVLGDGATEGSNNLYVLHDGRWSFVADVGYEAILGNYAALSPDGSRIAFSTVGQVDPHAGGFSQVYTADADASDTTATCVSCRSDGSDAQGLADFGGADLSAFVPPSRPPAYGAIGADGRVFFTSTDALLPEDTNGTADVYQYRDGALALISTGKDPGGAVFAGASTDGTDVFLITAERLVAQDTDSGVADMYSARVGGGFSLPEDPPSCGTDCQGPGQQPFVPLATASSAPGGSGNVVAPSTPPSKPSVRLATVTAKQRTAWATRGRVTLRVRASVAGTVRATVAGRLGTRGVRVASASRNLLEAGTATLTLRLSKRARIYLARHHALRLTITVRHAGGGSARQATLTLRTPATKRTDGGAR